MDLRTRLFWCAVAIGLWGLAPAQAATVPPDPVDLGDDRMVVASWAWLSALYEVDIDVYGIAFESHFDDVATYVAYCSAPIRSPESLRGRHYVVPRQTENAIDFFTAVMGTAPWELSYWEIAGSLASGLIDCVMFGGVPSIEALTQGLPLPPPGPALRALDDFAAANGAVADHRDLEISQSDWKWLRYRFGAGDIEATASLMHYYRREGLQQGRPELMLVSGYLGGRIYELAPDAASLPRGTARNVYNGECKDRPQDCEVIQQELKRLGLYDGPIDGVVGSGTRRAIQGLFGSRPMADPKTLLSPSAFYRNPGWTPPRMPLVTTDILADWLAEPAPPPEVADPPPPEPDQVALPEGLDDF